jgi:hypothetical protein
MNYDFHSNFNSSVQNCDFENANKCLMTELANILVRSKSDFVDMLNESGVYATISMSDTELTNLFITNAPNNKKLLLGASLLTNVHNKQMGFDGEDEISDSGVKTGYAVMNSYFNDETHEGLEQETSNFLPIGLILKGAQKLLGKRKEGKGGDSEAAKQQMLLQIRMQKEAEAKRKAKTRNAWLIGGGAVLLLGIVAIVVVKSRR